MFIMLMRTQGHFTQGTDPEGYINAELRRVATSGERKRLVNEVVGGNLQRYCKITVLKKGKEAKCSTLIKLFDKHICICVFL